MSAPPDRPAALADLLAIEARWDDPADRYWHDGNGASCAAYNKLVDEASADVRALAAELRFLRAKVLVIDYAARERRSRRAEDEEGQP